MSEMFNPPHPGLTLREDVLPALGLGVGEAAAQLGVDRVTLSKVLNARAGISPAHAAMRLKYRRHVFIDVISCRFPYRASSSSRTLRGTRSKLSGSIE